MAKNYLKIAKIHNFSWTADLITSRFFGIAYFSPPSSICQNIYPCFHFSACSVIYPNVQNFSSVFFLTFLHFLGFDRFYRLPEHPSTRSSIMTPWSLQKNSYKKSRTHVCIITNQHAIINHVPLFSIVVCRGSQGGAGCFFLLNLLADVTITRAMNDLTSVLKCGRHLVERRIIIFNFVLFCLDFDSYLNWNLGNFIIYDIDIFEESSSRIFLILKNNEIFFALDARGKWKSLDFWHDS